MMASTNAPWNMRLRLGESFSKFAARLASFDCLAMLLLYEITAVSCCHRVHNCEKRLRNPASIKACTALASRFSFNRKLSFFLKACRCNDSIPEIVYEM